MEEKFLKEFGEDIVICDPGEYYFKAGADANKVIKFFNLHLSQLRERIKEKKQINYGEDYFWVKLDDVLKILSNS